MSTEPERDIEKLLRDYARHRRDQGGEPPALHPAARRLLQAEVARQKTGARRAAGLGWLWATWPRIIAGGSVAVALVIAGVVVLPSLWRNEPGPAMLAKNESPSKKELSALRKQAPQPQTPASDAASRPAQAFRDENMSRYAEPVAAAKTPKDALANSNALAGRNAAPTAASATTLAAAPVMPPPATPAPTATLAPDARAGDNFRALAGTPAPGNATITQEFLRVNPATARAGRGGAANRRDLVLRSFRVEQNGGQIRVIDSDGSIYTGVVTTGSNFAGEFAANAAVPPIALDQEKAKSVQYLSDAAALKGQAASLAAGYFFRVSGTNRTLNQPVEFSGNFVANDQPTAGPAAVGGGGAGRFGGAADSAIVSTNAPAGSAGNPTPVFNFRLQGQAVIGTNQIGITALPTRP